MPNISVDEALMEAVHTQPIPHKKRGEKLPPLSKNHCEKLISAEILRLAQKSDFVVWMKYDLENSPDPVDHQLYDYKKGATPDQVPTALDFEGIYVWHFCKYDEECFSAKKLMIEREFGHYVSGQVGDFEGFRDEFPQYIIQDRWIEARFQSEQNL